MSLARKSSFLFAALLVVSSVTPLLAQAQTVTLSAVLTGGQEAPPTSSTGFGTATFTIDPSRTILTVDITVSGIGPTIAAAHIHKAPVGASAAPVIAFTASSFANGHLIQTITLPDSTLLSDIVAHPEQYYVNVHTPTFGSGAIRGQLAISGGGATLLGGELRAANEPASMGATSLAVGAYSITIDASRSVLTWDVNIGTLQNPSAAHIHKAPVGTSGGIVVPLVTNASGFVGNRAHGVVVAPDAATVALFADIAANPSAYYVNVHNTAAPGGALRGQIAAIDPTNEWDVPVIGKVNTFVTDVRIFNPSFSNRATALLEYFTGASNVSATATLSVDVPPRGTVALDDVNGLNALSSAGTIGGLRVTSQSKLVVTSRIFDDQRLNGKGTIGQSVNAISRANALTSGVIPGLASNSAFRTNVGFFNPSTSSVVVRVELRNNAGDLVGSNVINLGSYQQTQLSLVGLFPNSNLSDQQSLTLSFTASAPIDAYGSIIDNTSKDPVAITAQADSGTATAP